MTHMKRALSWLCRASCIVTLATVSSFVALQTSAESALPPIDERCEVTKAYLSFEKRAFRLCDIEFNECVEEQMSSFNQSDDQASDHCWHLPLSIDLDFDGPCPKYMAELESRTNDDSESLMQLVLVRNHFNRRNEFGGEIDKFKRSESLQSIRSMLAEDPNNLVAVRLLRWTLLFTDDPVEQLDSALKIQRLDPDCPNLRSLFVHGTFGTTNEIVDNWLAGEGPGSELTTSEMSDLFSRLQQTLLELYDVAIEDSDHSEKLNWALRSVHDGILTREFENMRLISRYVDTGLDDYTENRRADLIRRFSNEYDVKSDHGRSQSLRTMCSSHALDLGLLDHCVKLLNHFGLLDSNLLDSPAPDWSRATISLMIGLTRDCSEHPELFLGWWPSWWGKQRCLEEHKGILVSNIQELLDRYTSYGKSAEREVIEAILRLDETSDERFLRALSLDGSMVVYASRLIKRLHKLGKTKTAANILTAIDSEMASVLSESEGELLSKTTDSVNEDTYKNWMESSWEM